METSRGYKSKSYLFPGRSNKKPPTPNKATIKIPPAISKNVVKTFPEEASKEAPGVPATVVGEFLMVVDVFLTCALVAVFCETIVLDTGGVGVPNKSTFVIFNAVILESLFDINKANCCAATVGISTVITTLPDSTLITLIESGGISSAVARSVMNLFCSV